MFARDLTIATHQIGINLSDPMFNGKYHGKQAHESDLDDVIQRARDVGCAKFMVTGSDLIESAQAVQIAQNYRESSDDSGSVRVTDCRSWVLLRDCGRAPLPG